MEAILAITHTTKEKASKVVSTTESAFFRATPAPSITVAPDVFWGRSTRKPFLAAVRQIVARSGAGTVTPFHTKQQHYLEPYGPCRPTTAPRDTPETPCNYADQPDVVTARKAFRSLGGEIGWCADDLIQEACTALTGRGADGEGLRFTIAKNAMQDVLRKEHLRELGRDYATDDDGKESPTEEERRKVEARPGTIGRDARVWDAVAALDPRQRAVIHLRFQDGCSHAEIALRMGTTERYAGFLVRAALDSLKEILGDEQTFNAPQTVINIEGGISRNKPESTYEAA